MKIQQLWPAMERINFLINCIIKLKEHSMQVQERPLKQKRHKQSTQNQHILVEDQTRSQLNKENYKRAELVNLKRKNVDESQNNHYNNFQKLSRSHPEKPILGGFLLLFSLSLAFEFSIQASLIVIQYIKGKIVLNSFCSLLIASLILFISVVISLCYARHKVHGSQVQIIPELSLQQNVNMQGQQNQISTLAMPRNQNIYKDKEKTIKIEKARIQQCFENPNMETVKKFATSKNKNQTQVRACKVKDSKQAFIVFVFVKLLQNLLNLVFISVCFGTIQNPVTQDFCFVTVMLLISYPLTAFSSILVIKLLLEGKENSKQFTQKSEISFKLKNQKSGEVSQCSKPLTALSIQQYISVRQVERKTHQKPKELQFEKKQQCQIIVKPLQPEIIKLPSVKISQEKQKAQKKCKSALKKAKSLKQNNELNKGTLQVGNMNTLQKRKVGINCRVEHFQYIKNSQRTSVFDETMQRSQVLSHRNRRSRVGSSYLNSRSQNQIRKGQKGQSKKKSRSVNSRNIQRNEINLQNNKVSKCKDLAS